MNVGHNVVSDYFVSTGDSFNHYEAGWCGPLTHVVSGWLSRRGVSHKRLMITRAREEGNSLYPAAKGQPNQVWYHAIIMVSNFIHCPWLNERLSVEQYCLKMFPGQKVTVEEDYNCRTTMWTDSEAKAA